MQGKVSMVVPCYNKESYIGAMLDSVLAQVWDNMELILVNDGSTDRTREIIAQYEPKLKARGYEVVIIDQENGGCCAAVYTGLIHMTGDYFCLVDCDDSIDPVYVSHMAGWLDGHDDYEWTACSYRPYHYIDGKLTVYDVAKCKYPQDVDFLLEKWMMRKTITMSWIYMTRVSYVKRCGMIENWCTERKKTYEPLIGVPLMAGRGKLKYFHEGLYHYHLFACDLYQFDRFGKAIAYYDDYLYLYEWAISRLNASDNAKRRLSEIARLSYEKELFLQVPRVEDGKEYLPQIAASTSRLIDEIFERPPLVPARQILETGYQRLFNSLEEILFPDMRLHQRAGRLIGYGALGRAAARLLPQLENTVWNPTELWDKDGDGVTVKKPEFESLSEEDMILVFPTLPEVVSEIERELEGTGAEVIYNHDIKARLQPKLKDFSQFEYARLKR